MARRQSSGRRPDRSKLALQIFSLIIVLSMVCGLLAALFPQTL